MEPITVLDRQSCRPPRAPQRDLGHPPHARCQHAVRRRDDLRGVHAFADVVEESVRWSA